MELFELLEMIRARPLVFLDEQKSLKALRVFLAGYERGTVSMGAKKSIFGDLRGFNNWVAKELGFPSATSGWCNMINARSDSDEQAFDRFFELLDKYRKLSSPLTGTGEKDGIH
jgi:hypothetical protein